MNAEPGPARTEEGIGWPKLLLTLGALVALSAALSVVLWWGKGWGEPPLEEPAAAPAEVPPAPARERKVRPATVAGRFYPGDPVELRQEVARLLAAAPPTGLRGVRAILVPHAGYVYSGAVAAASFREVDPGFRRVFVLASNHSGAADYSGPSLPAVTHYAIPGAEIPLAEVVDELRGQDLFEHEPEAHRMHMIEVELPFLHQLRGWPEEPDWAIVPMILGRMGAEAVDRLVDVLDAHADDETLFVFSVDLSHFHPDERARRLDAGTVHAIMTQDREALDRAVTDGNHVLQTMVALARRRGWEPTFLAARNSGDVSGDLDRVVGYAAIVFSEPFRLSEQEGQELIGLARRTIEERVRHGRDLEVEEDWLDRHPAFRIPCGVFVTIKRDGKLRGCIGETVARRPLAEAVRRFAVEAAIHDPRFPPLEEGELAGLDLSVSVLGHPEVVKVDRPEQYLEVLRPMKDGVILLYEGRQSTFLPQVWADLRDPEAFLTRLSLKQGSPPDAWKDPAAVLYRYPALVFGE